MKTELCLLLLCIGYRLIQGKLAEKCTTHDNCTAGIAGVPNSWCDPTSEACWCQPGYDIRDGKCILEPLGNECNASETDFLKSKCKVPDSHCNASSVCSCNHGYIKVNVTLCSPLPVSQTTCSATFKCPVKNSTCDVISGFCRCDSGFTEADADNSTCRQLQIYEYKCTVDDDCRRHVDNSICSLTKAGNVSQNGSSTCQCKDGWVVNSKGVCVQCSNTSMCLNILPHSVCNGAGRCVCEPGYVGDSDTGCTVRRLFTACKANSDCEALPGSVCVVDGEEKKCGCQQGFRPVLPFYLGCEQVSLGDQCSVSQDCSSVNNSICSEGGCSCAQGFITAGPACRPRGLRDECDGDGDCHTVTGAECLQGVCACPRGRVYKEGRGCERRRLYGSCQTGLDCSEAVSYSTCVASRCVCLPLYSVVSESCLPQPANLFDHCLDDLQCQALGFTGAILSRCAFNDTRQQKVCTCKETAMHHTSWPSNKEECHERSKSIDDQCVEDIQCERSVRGSICARASKGPCRSRDCPKICKCRKEEVLSGNGAFCHTAPKKLGDPCNDDLATTNKCSAYMDDVTGLTDSKARCINFTCVCPVGFTQDLGNPRNDTCLERPHLPLPATPSPPSPHLCDDARKCAGGAVCKAHICVCESRTAWNAKDGRCVAVQTYHVRMQFINQVNLSISGYDMQPLAYSSVYKSPSAMQYQLLAHRVTTLGLGKLTWSRGEALPPVPYVNSEIIAFTPAYQPPGVIVKALVHVSATPRYHHALRAGVIAGALNRSLGQTFVNYTEFPRQLGASGLQVALGASLIVKDYDECSPRASASRHTCHINANCVNTLGSYVCVCRPQHRDVHEYNATELKGRKCEWIDPVKEAQRMKFKKPNDGKEIVIFGIAAFLFILFLFIVYEIVKRKETFNARKLYEKFGTTNIRKLQRASMRKIQEAKQLKKRNSSKKRRKSKKENSNKDVIDRTGRTRGSLRRKSADAENRDAPRGDHVVAMDATTPPDASDVTRDSDGAKVTTL